MSETLLEVADLNKRFGNVVVAQSLSFQVRKGEALGIVGPNGAGKSTLLNLINGNEALDSGTLTFEDESLNKLSSAQRSKLGIARTFQIPKPFSGMTVFENVLVAGNFAPEKLRSKEREQRALEAIERTGLAE